MTDWGIVEAYQGGLYARDDSLAQVRERFGVAGSSDASRVFEVRVAGGFEFEVLPSHGFDIGRAWVRGLPIGWTSPVTDYRPIDHPADRSWIDRFTGGLLATCGLEHIGAATADLPMHGSLGSRPVSSVNHFSGMQGDVPFARLTATIDVGTVFGPSARVHRTIETDVTPTGSARLRIEDRIENRGPGDFPLKALYHLNFGAPAVVPGSVVEFDGSSPQFREPCSAVPDPRVMPEPVEEYTEAVLYHADATVDHDGWARASVTSPTGLRVDVRWTADTLPHPHQWILPTRGRWALGIEPATSPLFGNQSHSVVPSGGSRVHEIGILVRV